MLPPPCFFCGHLTRHKALGPNDNNGFAHYDRCEQCECFCDPTFDPETRIRHSLDDHVFVPVVTKRVMICGYVRNTAGLTCSMPRHEHSRRAPAPVVT